MLVARIAVLGVVLAGCGATARPKFSWPDAPVTLRDDADRDQAIDHLWVMPLGAERDKQRAAIAAAVVRRISDAIVEERPFAAAALLDQLTAMWQHDPTTVGRGLAIHVELLQRLRGMFAKSGALEPTVQTLVLLAEIEPGQRAAHVAEIDEILAFADELAISDNGINAGRAQPIALLQPTALALPLPWLVNRYIELLSLRQRVISGLIEKQGASMEIVRAHHDILSTSRRIANALARAGRVGEIHSFLERLKGLGIDRELTTRAEIVAENPTPDAYVELASALRADDPPGTGDPAGALAVCLAGLVKFRDDPSLLTAAGGDAKALGRVEHAILLYEGALRGADEVDTMSALRLGKLYGDRISRLATGGRPAAAHDAWRDVLTFTTKEAQHHPHTVWQQAQAIAESALGRGLASQGLLPAAKRALTGSIDRAPSIDAYETLTTIHVQTNEFRAAQEWAEGGMSLLGDATTGDRYRRAKLERLSGDALRGAGKPREGAARYLDALRSWASLGEDKNLPRGIAAERHLEFGRMLWWLGESGRAADEVMKAVDLDPDAPAMSTGAVAFLIEANRYRDAIDAWHRGLGANISDFYKVHMALWVAGEAKRRGEAVDRLAADYLGSRHGDTWYELLARAATGRLSYEIVAGAATTGPRQAELAFYGALFGFHPQAASPAGKRKLLEQVVLARVVLDAHYDLARLYLSQLSP